jgi:MutS-like protein
MKVLLMHEDRALDLEGRLQPRLVALTQDLELETLFAAMARGDELILDIVRKVVLARDADVSVIAYRHAVLADALEHPLVVRELFALAGHAVETERKRYLHLSAWSSPDSVLSRSVEVCELFVSVLRRLRAIADERSEMFRSPGFRRFFEMLTTELDDPYFDLVEAHLSTLRFRGGIPISARLGRGNKGTGYVLRTPRARRWLDRVSPAGRARSFSFQVAARDESGTRALADVRARGVDLVADVLARSDDHILGFFKTLRSELAFYVGCLNLRDELAAIGEPTAFPEATDGGPAFTADGLYDPCLALTVRGTVVPNDVRADGRPLVVITGANQGGKSTFLRSVGLAQLMLQSGMFVAADRLRADVRRGVLTHYKRKEDASIERGKLDEELARMSDIVEEISPGSILLCNESFASTNEREGSEIARHVVGALTDAGVKVFFVTHLYDLASGLFEQHLPSALFLRAERGSDGTRTFRLVEGEPMSTSFGEDLYRRIFGEGGAGGEVEEAGADGVRAEAG